MYGYNQTPAASLPLNEWTDYSSIDTHGIYGAATLAFETAWFHKGQIVGNVVKGIPYSRSGSMKDFGLVMRTRRIGDPNAARDKEIRKREAQRAKAAAAKSYEEVITLEFNARWELISKNIETRTVYQNKTNRVIKTRSNGSPVVHEYKGKNYVVFAPNMNGRIVNQKVWTEGLPALLDKA